MTGDLRLALPALQTGRRHRAVSLVLGSAVLLALFGSGCASEPQTGPPEIEYGVDVCDECGMIMSDPRFAAAIRLRTRDKTETRVFDDIGDMLTHLRKQPELEVAEYWVHDFKSEEWLAAREATFVRSGAVTSPMGHGLAAFGSSDAAREFAATVDGDVLDFETLITSEGESAP